MKQFVRLIVPSSIRLYIYRIRRAIWTLLFGSYVRRRIIRQAAGKVSAGPFIGLNLGPILEYEDFACAFVLGTFEKELHTSIERACELGMDVIVNVGSAEGYYAVGLALRLPNSEVITFEMDPVTRAKIPELASLNDLQDDRINMLGMCETESLGRVLASNKKNLIICDVEGYEEVLMDPEVVPGLRDSFLLVEAHEGFVPGISELLHNRFQDTHLVKKIEQAPRTLSDTSYRSIFTALAPFMFVEHYIQEPRMKKDCWLWMEPNIKR